MRYAGLIGAGITELLHLKYLAPASAGDFFEVVDGRRLGNKPSETEVSLQLTGKRKRHPSGQAAFPVPPPLVISPRFVRGFFFRGSI